MFHEVNTSVKLIPPIKQAACQRGSEPLIAGGPPVVNIAGGQSSPGHDVNTAASRKPWPSITHSI